MMAIEILYKELNRGHKAAISRKLHKLGFAVEWQQNTVVVQGIYWGRAVDLLNEMGYETDDPEQANV